MLGRFLPHSLSGPADPGKHSMEAACIRVIFTSRSQTDLIVAQVCMVNLQQHKAETCPRQSVHIPSHHHYPRDHLNSQITAANNSLAWHSSLRHLLPSPAHKVVGNHSAVHHMQPKPSLCLSDGHLRYSCHPKQLCNTALEIIEYLPSLRLIST